MFVLPSPAQQVALVTEGGYPYSAGGVSVWCDQVISGMPQRLFEVVSLVGAQGQPPAFELPGNVQRLTSVALWSQESAGRAPRGRALARFVEVFSRLIGAAFGPGPAPGDFASALRGLYEYAQTEELRAAMRSEQAVRIISESWRVWPPSSEDPGSLNRWIPPVGDAVIVAIWLEHMLRPLSLQAPTVDLVHCASNGLAGLVALGAKWTYGTPFVVSEHGVYLRERYLAHRETTYSWAVKSALLRFTRALTVLVYAEAALIAPGNMYNRRWELNGGADPEAIVTVYNGVDPEQFPVCDVEPAEPTLVYMGRIDPLKDIEGLIRSFALVVAQVPGSRLRIFGTAPPRREDYLERCIALIGELKLDKRISFEGRSESAHEAYAAGQVVVLSSISEGFPYTVIEAMCSGRATVSTDVGGVAEAVGDAGMVVPARNAEALAAACISLLRDAKERHRLGAAARSRVLDRFTLAHSIRSLEAVYKSVLESETADPIALPRLVRPA